MPLLIYGNKHNEDDQDDQDDENEDEEDDEDEDDVQRGRTRVGGSFMRT